jgi:hypothetical protein
MRVQVESLSDARWARIERDLFAKLDESGKAPATTDARRPSIAWAPALAAALVLLCAIARPWGAVRSDLRMRLATTDGASQFTVGESSLAVAAHSLLMVGGDDEHGIDVVLDRGAVTCEVAPRRGRPPFLLNAGEARLRVVGTRFTVAHIGSDTTVDVDHGTVEVSASGAVAVLHDGDHWPPRPPPMAAAAAAAGGVGSRLAPVDVLPTPQPDPTPTPARTPPTRKRGLASTQGEAVPVETPPADAPATSAPATSSAPPVPPTPQETFESAATLERAKPDQAATAYRDLAAGNTEWAANALFALARLQVDRGDRAEGIHLLKSYLARYPRGMNADDARELLRRAQ